MKRNRSIVPKQGTTFVLKPKRERTSNIRMEPHREFSGGLSSGALSWEEWAVLQNMMMGRREAPSFEFVKDEGQFRDEG